MDLSTFDSHDAAAPLDLAWGFIELWDLRGARARVTCFVEGAGREVAGIRLTNLPGAGDTFLVQIKMYQLPAAEAALAADLKSNGTHRPWPVPGGRPFDSSMLAPRQIPAGWRHTATQTVSPGGNGIKHAWRSGNRALLVRYILQRGDVLTHPLSQWVEQNLRPAADIAATWRLDLPVPSADREDDELTGPDDMSDGHGPGEDVYALADDDENSTGSRASAAFDRPLTAEEQIQVDDNAMRGWNHLKLGKRVDGGDAILAAIHHEVDRLRPTFAALKPNARLSVCVFLGSLWGNLLTKGTGWRWCGLTRDGGDEFLAIVSPDRAYAVSPVDFMIHLLTRPEPGGDNTVRLLFNMIRARKLPPSKPRQYLMLS